MGRQGYELKKRKFSIFNRYIFTTACSPICIGCLFPDHERTKQTKARAWYIAAAVVVKRLLSNVQIKEGDSPWKFLEEGGSD